MKKYKPNKNQANPDLEKEKLNNEEDDEKVDYNGIEVVVDRVEHGLIGTLRIESEINKPLLRKNDMAHIRATQRPFIKDIILYRSHEEYFLRRIIKIKEDTAYVAGDSEKSYHIIHRNDIVGKVIGRERKGKFLSFGLNPKKKFYTFRKVSLAPIRLGNRVTNYEQDVNNEALAIAQQNLEREQQAQQKPQYNVALDLDLSSFLDPDVLVSELRSGKLNNLGEEQATEEVEYEEVIEYVEEEEIVEEQVEVESEEEIIEETALDESLTQETEQTE